MLELLAYESNIQMNVKWEQPSSGLTHTHTHLHEHMNTYTTHTHTPNIRYAIQMKSRTSVSF